MEHFRVNFFSPQNNVFVSATVRFFPNKGVDVGHDVVYVVDGKALLRAALQVL
jgi:hypothetical protein